MVNRKNLQMLLMLMFVLTPVACDNKGADQNAALSDVQLSDVRDNLRLWEVSKRQSSSNPELMRNIAESTLKHVMLVRSLNPDINKLGGEGLETLCLMLGDTGKEILSSVGDKELVALARDYLASVEKSVENRISDLQKTMRGSGCYVSPEPGDR